MAVDARNKWVIAKPCPICGKTDNCKAAIDGSAVYCARVSSDREPNGGGQWLHRIDDDHKRDEVRAAVAYLHRESKTTRAAPDDRFERSKGHQKIHQVKQHYAEKLGITVESLDLLEMGAEGANAIFPERSGSGELIGLVTRSPTGSKRSEGRRGLTIPTAQPGTGPLLIVEGQSDVAAALSMGLRAIGRPSNSGGVEHLATYLADRNERVIVLGENDRKRHSELKNQEVHLPNCAGCQVCWPGLAAESVAEQLAEKLDRPIESAMPPEGTKDVRGWLCSGGDGDGFIDGLAVIEPGKVEPPEEDFTSRIITAKQLREMDCQREWIIPHILPVGEQMVIGAPEKSLKTSILMEIAVTIAAGDCLFERQRFRCTQRRRVLFLTAESGWVSVKNLKLRVTRSKGIHPEAIDEWLQLGDELPVIETDTDIAALTDYAIDQKIGVVMIDPAYIAMFAEGSRKQSGDVLTMGPLLRRLTKFQRITNATVILAHHTRKPPKNQYGKWQSHITRFDDLAQAGFAQWMRCWLLLSRLKEYRHDGWHTIQIEAGGSAGHSGLYVLTVNEGKIDSAEPVSLDEESDPNVDPLIDWECRLRLESDYQKSEDARKEKRKEEDESGKQKTARANAEKLFAVLDREPDTKSSAAERAGLSPKYCATALELLRAENRVRECPVEKNGKTHQGWQAVSPTSPTTQADNLSV